jgi:hypothetical protein
MHLSGVYANRQEWGMVYHTQPGSSEVEMVKEVFFTSEAAAWEWFNKSHNVHDYIEPEAVQFVGFHVLQLRRPESKQVSQG